MSADDAAEFARGMFGPFGAISYLEGAVYPFGIGFIEEGDFVFLGGGLSWSTAADRCVHECEISATNGYGPWEVPF